MSEPCAIRDWDSRFFSRKIAQVEGARLDEGRLRDIDAWCRANAIDGLYFLADADDQLTVELAERHGFGLKDVRMTLTRPLSATTATDRAAELVVRSARADDLPALETIAATSHRQSRFYADAQLAGRADELYRAWIRNSIGGWADDVLVLAASSDSPPLGYITGHRRDGEGQIGLLAVADSARGKGGGAQLVTALMTRWSPNLTTASVVTQGRNVGALRFYERLEFETRRLELWYHRWAS